MSDVPAPIITVAPTVRARCQKTRRQIEKGEFRYTTCRGEGNHFIVSHTALVHVTSRVMKKHVDEVDRLLSGIEGAGNKEVARRIVDAILRGEEPLQEDKDYRCPQQPKLSKPRKRKATKDAVDTRSQEDTDEVVVVD